MIAYALAACLGVALGIALTRRSRSLDAHIADALALAEPGDTLHHVGEPPSDYGYEPTPIGDAAFRAAIDRACRIEVACEEFAEEVAALADSELAELIERGEK